MAVKIQGSSRRTIVVFAADHNDYRNWVRRFGQHLNNVDFKMAKTYKDVKGKHRNKTYVMFLEGCEMHPNYRDMFQYVWRLKHNAIKRQMLEKAVFDHLAKNNIDSEFRANIPEINPTS